MTESTSKHEVECRTCGEPVVRLPYAANPSVRISMQPQAYPTSQVAERDRWAWKRGYGLVSLDGHPAPPPHCLLVHPCASWFAHRGGGGVQGLPASFDEHAAASAVDRIVETGKERDREHRRRVEQKRYSDPNDEKHR